jgi:hypothetical protein
MKVCCVLALSAAALSFAQAPAIGNCTILPADNIWNTPVDTLPLHANSATYVNTIGVASPVHPDFGSGTWNGGPIGIPFIKVAGTQTKYPATFLYADESDPGPYAIPLNAPIEGGSNATGDRHAIAIDTDNCVLYELFSAYPQSASWRAGSGAIFNLKSNALRPSTWTSADAAGLPILPGLLRYDEVASGEIRHAIRFTAPQTRRAFVWPARHYASSLTDARYPAMGQRFRLKASFDITPFPAEVQVILRALKKYGMILADNGSSWFLSGAPDPRWNDTNLRTLRNITGSAFEAVDVSSLMIDPNSGQAKQQGVSVTIAPAQVTVITQAPQQFTATVQGSADTRVTWSVNGIAGGNSQTGYVDANGLYSAPSAVPNPATVNVQATSDAAPAVLGTAMVTIRYPAPVITSVAPGSINTGTFTLAIDGTGFQSEAVVRLNGAALATTFVSSMRLTASGSTSTPGSAVPVTVRNQDGQVSNAFNIAVNGTAPVTVGVSPATASVRVRRTRQFTATVQNTTDKRVTWKVNGITGGNATIGTISATGLYTAPATRPTPNTVTVAAVSVADTSKSGSARVTITRR